MTAQIGADGLDLFGAPHPELLANAVRLPLEPGGEWADIEVSKNRPGFRSTQRLWISNVADGVAVATWPAEKGEQARYLYGRKLGTHLVKAATEREWKVEPSPHIAFFNSRPSSRLYMTCPSISALDYVALWEKEGALSRVRYRREDVESSIWRWLKQRGIADHGDDAELRRFLSKYLTNPKADMRPGLRFRKVWTFDQVKKLGSEFAETIRSEFDAVFAAAHEPKLRSLKRQEPEP